MNLHNLSPADNSKKSSKRIGRGQGSGKGGTSTKGHKGDQSRSGARYKASFEGGQMPIQRRFPKFGFKNPFRVEYVAVSFESVSNFLEKQSGFGNVYNVEVLKQQGVLPKSKLYKLLGKGTLPAGSSVKFDAYSKSAQEALSLAGVTVL